MMQQPKTDMWGWIADMFMEEVEGRGGYSADWRIDSPPGYISIANVDDQDEPSLTIYRTAIAEQAWQDSVETANGECNADPDQDFDEAFGWIMRDEWENMPDIDTELEIAHTVLFEAKCSLG